MRRSSIVFAVVLALCAAGLTAARPQPALALSSGDLRVEQDVQLLKGYIEAQGARHGFVYPARATVRKGGGLSAPIWPVNPFSGLPMAPGAAPGHFTYTVAADGLSYHLVGHLSDGRGYAVHGGSPAWLARERAKSAADLKTAQDGLAAAQGQVGLLQGWLSQAQDQVATLQGQLSDAQAQVDANNDEVTKLGTEYIAAVADAFAAENNGTFPQSVANQGSMVDTSGQPLYDYWPVNPWTGALMKDSTATGDYTYSMPTGHSFHITGHLSNWGSFAIDDDAATDPIMIGLVNHDDRAAEAGCQAIKDYVDEWAAAHGGDLPTTDQLTASGDVGVAHAWWPTDPFLGIKMAPGTNPGQFVYAPADDGTFTVAVNLFPTGLYPATYTAK